MLDDIAAVPSDDNAYGEAVSDEEFLTWVKRSQSDTEKVLREWDHSVEFTQRELPVLVDTINQLIDDDHPDFSEEERAFEQASWMDNYGTVTITQQTLGGVIVRRPD